jgi:hypothetical protein
MLEILTSSSCANPGVEIKMLIYLGNRSFSMHFSNSKRIIAGTGQVVEFGR